MRNKKRRRDAGRPRGEPIVDAVLEHTLAELTQFGIAGLSIDRVAKKADVNKTSVYRRWPTREALVGAALERVLVDVAALVPNTGSLRGDLLGILTPVSLLLTTDLGKAVLRAALTDSTSASVSALLTRQLESTSKPMRAVVERACARKEWQEGTDPKQLVFMLVGACIHRALLEHEALSKRWLEKLVDLAVNGVKPRPKQA